MRKSLVVVMVVAAMGVLPGCEQQTTTTSVGVSRAGLEQAPRDNIFSRAVAQEPVGAAWIMVPEADYVAALKGVSGAQSPVGEELIGALSVASAANESWTSGVTAINPKEGAVEGVHWVVVTDAQSLADGRIIASQFRLGLVRLSFNASWSASGELAFTKEVGAMGAGRCCGPTVLCNSPPGNPGPCGKGGYCGADAWVLNSDTGAAGAGGHASRQIELYAEGLPLPTDCHARLAPSCTNTNSMCGKEVGISIAGDWDSTLPNGTGACGGVGESPVGGRSPPPSCLYANSVGVSATPTGEGRSVALAGGRFAVCDGRCFECESLMGVGIDSRDHKKFRPRQCDLVKTAPPGSPGAPGSGVCTAASSSEILAETAQLRIQIEFFGGPNGIGTHCEFINNQGLEMCTSCDLEGCRTYARRAGVEYPPPGNHQVSRADSATSGTGAISVSNTRQADRTLADGPPSAGIGPGGPMGPLVGAGGAADEGATPQQNVENDDKTTKADPIALGSGAFELSQTDLSLPGPVRPLEFTRSYDSRSNHRSTLGSNWTHNWDVRVVPLNDYNRPSWVDPFCAGSPEETTCLMLHIGATERLFTLDVTTGVYTPQAGVFSSITKIASGWRLVGADMHRMEFDADGYLVLDIDRFDHGFMLEYEYTPQGEAFNTYCPRELPRPSRSSGTILDPSGPPGGFQASHAFCQVLGGLVGQRRPSDYRLLAGDEWSLAGHWPTTRLPYFARLMDGVDTSGSSLPGRNGSPMPWGASLKRVTRTREIASVAYVGADRIPSPVAGGRALRFTYAPEGQLLSDGRLEDGNLLERVSVENQPLSVSFKYDVPTPANAETAWLNEVLLQSVTREDGRFTRFEYGVDKLDASKLTLAADRYREFVRAQVNCTSYTNDHCGKPVFSTFTRYNIESEVASYRAALLSQAADNISLVARGSIVESETRYQVDPFSPSFDRATAQRWGSSSVAPTPLTGTFTTTLPEAHLEYAEAMPINDGADDATTAFVGALFAARYPLETAPAGAVSAAGSKGMLLAPDSADGTRIPNRYPMLAEGFFVPQVKEPIVPACKNSRLPWLRSRLAGYAPSLDYFDPDAPAVEGSTPGVDLEASLKRSRLSCASLAMAQTWDARHNDLQWTWAKDGNGEMQATRVLGRRAKTNGNANRICAWSRVTDRDGVAHLNGLNYQGRTLVDAVQLSTNDWRVAETLYNADGNVISQRRTMPIAASWAPASGDTQYEYMDVYKDGTGQLFEPLPFYWSRRGNVTQVIERPRGLVEDYKQNSTAPPTTPTGRFVRYAYEPLFNQVRQVVSGSLPGGVVDSVVDVTFDYQEGNVGALTSLLEYQQTLGFQYQVTLTTVGSVTTAELNAGTALEWPVSFDLGDQNADLLVGSTVLGLPVKVVANGETTLYRWNEGGRLTSLQRPDGTELRNEYYAYGVGSGASAEGDRALLAKQHHVGRTSWWANPSLGAGCAALSGPYQWLLPAGCSASELQSVLKLPAEAVAHIMAPSLDGTLTLEYDVRGHLRRRVEPDGRVLVWERDVDGRVTGESLSDGTVLHSSLEIAYDTLKRPTTWTSKDAAGAVIGKLVKAWDEEDHVLVDCAEWNAGACTNVAHGDSPAGASANSYYYTREGRLERQVDPEGAQLEYVRDARGWVLRTIASAPGELTRESCTTWDDDANVTRTDFGGGCGAGVLSETRGYDGFNRLTSLRDTQGRRFTVKHSSRDLVLEVAFVGTPSWKTSWTYDALGRVRDETLNGTLVEQYKRAPGGLVVSAQSYGRSAVFTTYDADGNVVWQRDADARITSVYTSRPNSRERTASTVRTEGGALHTTSSVSTFAVTGLPATTVETGESTTATRLSRTTTFVHDAKGLLRQRDDPDGAVVEFVYDFGGRLELKKEHVPSGFEETKYGYDKRGATAWILDPKNETTSATYTGFGELKTRTSPGAGGAVVAQFFYDSLGRTTEEHLGASRLGYTYNARGQLFQIHNGEVLREYAYDPHGRVEKATHFNKGPSLIPQGNRAVTTAFTWDWAGRTATESNTIDGRPTRTVGSTWSGGSMPTNLTRFSTRPGSTVDDRLDGLGRLDRQTRPTGSGNWSYLGEMTTERSISAGAGTVRTRLERDALGQVLRESTVGATAATFEFDFLRDEAGRTGSLVKRIGLPSGVETSWRGFTYDTQGRLSELHEAPAAPSISVGSGSAANVRALSANVGAGVWAYAREPKVGSTVSITGPGPARLSAATRGAGYQLSSYSVAGGTARGLTYDTAGRVATHAGLTHSWDDFSMLTRVTGGGVEESLQYDGVGRLVARYDAAGLVEEYVLDGEQMVAALDKSGAQMWSAYWGQGVDNLVTMVRGGVEFTAATDGRGSIGAWYHSGSATLAATAEYTPEGRAKTREVQGGATCDEVGNTSTCAGPLGLPFGFHGAFKSPGTGLLYFRNRWYSAVSGEWLSQDPLGPVDSHNLYAFNGFDSVNFIDPFGLDSNKGAGKNTETVHCTEDGISCKEANRRRREAANQPTTGRNAADGDDAASGGVKGRAQGRPERSDGPSSGGGSSNRGGRNGPGRGGSWVMAITVVPTGTVVAGSTAIPIFLSPRAPSLNQIGLGLLLGGVGCTLIPDCKGKMDGIAAEASRLSDALDSRARRELERLTAGQQAQMAPKEPEAAEPDANKPDEKPAAPAQPAPPKTVEDLIKNAKPGQPTKGRADQYEKEGGMNEANDDFDSLQPSDVKPIRDGGRVGTLKNGDVANVRPTSSDGRPTLEVKHKTRQTKIRYGGRP
ncbi:MAG: DUF6531 domain-containing protein [Archangium sp.]|nr:DUF6531 domain-containing protein [Archangium sp.]